MIEHLLEVLLFLTARVVGWALVLPVAAARWAYRGTARAAGATRLVTHDVVTCASCLQGVSLVGRYRCGRCGYVFDGFAFTRCAVCSAVPPYIPCSVCGAGLRNPVHRRERGR